MKYREINETFTLEIELKFIPNSMFWELDENLLKLFFLENMPDLLQDIMSCQMYRENK